MSIPIPRTEAAVGDDLVGNMGLICNSNVHPSEHFISQKIAIARSDCWKCQMCFHLPLQDVAS